MKPVYLFPLFLVLIHSCASGLSEEEVLNVVLETPQDTLKSYEQFFNNHPKFQADYFQFPVGPPHADGYYNAQYFGINLHLGEDWNGNGGGNSDLGDPIFSVAHGYVYEAKDCGGGWGNVVRVIHQYKEHGKPKLVESLYAHLDSMWVEPGDSLQRGEQLGTMGNADGAYYAHLHLEMRDSMEMDLGPGYSSDTAGYIKPTAFIKAHGLNP